MQGVAQALLRVFAVIACFVCASGVCAAANAQSTPADDRCSAPDQDAAPDSDLGSESTGSDFAEQDDDDDCDQEPPILGTQQRIEHARWDCPLSDALPASLPVVPGHQALDPRPPR